MKIIGAGMAGLIAANYFRKSFPTVYEKQPNLPINHQALLRFKNDNISKMVGIPFKKVFVRKALIHDTSFVDEPNIYCANSYSLKTNGKILDRSVWDLTPDHRWIAPIDFSAELAKGLDIRLNSPVSMEGRKDLTISTIPMPIMMNYVGWELPKFEYKSIWVISAQIKNMDIDVCQTIYFSSLLVPYYRASLIGQRLIIELVSDWGLNSEDSPNQIVDEVLDYFSIPTGFSETDILVKEQKYGKIIPISEDERLEFIYTLTKEYDIYSLGRFATWKQIVLDDLIKDLHVIEKLISVENRRSLYAQNLSSVSHS